MRTTSKKCTVFLLCVVIVSHLVAPGSIRAALSINSVLPNIAKIGEDLQLSISGEGFDASTRVSMSLDIGNSMKILGSLQVYGGASDVTVVGNTAYVVSWDGLKIISLSDSASPRLMGEVATPGQEVVVVAGKAYIADNDAGLQIIDVTNSARPTVLASLATPGAAKGLAVFNNIAYVADWEAGLTLIDISDEANLQILATVDTPGQAHRVAVENNLAYVADEEFGIQVIDVSTPASPQIIGSVQTEDWANDIAINGTYAYVASFGNVEVFDISNSQDPYSIGTVVTPGLAAAITIMNDIAYVADTYGGLQVIDVSVPTSSKILTMVDTPGEAQGVAIVNDLAYVADGEEGIQVLDVSNPTSQQDINKVQTQGIACDVVVDGTLAYVADCWGSLQVVDLSEPTDPQVIGSIETGGEVQAIAIDGNLAYAAANSGGLQVISIGNPTRPETVGSLSELTSVRGVVVHDKIAYLADGSRGFISVDINDPTKPVITSEIATPGEAQKLIVSDNMAYVAYVVGRGDLDDGGLQVIDLSNPSTPVLVGSVDTPGSAENLAIVGQTIYLADGQRGLQVIDVSTPSQPVILGEQDTDGKTLHVSVNNNIAYLADGWNGLQAVDVSDPAHPCIIGEVQTPGEASGLWVTGNNAYVAAGGNGLVIVSVPVEVLSVRVNSSTSINITLPSPALSGSYNIRVFEAYAENELAGAVTFMATDYYEAFQNKKAIIIAGGGPNVSGGTLWDETKVVTNQAYLALRRQGYADGQIYFLSHEAQDPDGDGISNVTGVPSLLTLETALTWGADASELLLYMTDHGGDGTLQLSSSDILTVSQLDNWLDTLQNAMNGRVIVIYDACYSGSFTAGLLAPAGRERVVITSSTNSERAWFSNGGMGSFSFQFWSSVYLTGNLYDSFLGARNMVAQDQTPWLDVDGDGVPNAKSDSTLASGIAIGRGVQAASAPPSIGDVNQDISLSSSETVTLWADGFTSLNPLSRVWAVISLPSAQSLEGEIPITDDLLAVIDLADTDGDGRYETSYNFSQQGQYRVSIHVLDENGFMGIPQLFTVAVGESVSVSIAAPILATSTSNGTATAIWTTVSNADSYTLYYAPYPYLGEHTISSMNMGSVTSISVELPPGAAYYVAVTSNNGSSESGYSNIELIVMGE